jgi:pyocin large subunit-like protein
MTRRAGRAFAGACLVLAALALIGLGCGRSESRSGATAPNAAPSITRPDVGFRSVERLEDHFRRHGREFGSVTRDEYLAFAQELRDRPAEGTVREAVRRDGVVTRFDRSSGAFIAFDKDGTIRTFFRPNDGEAYFERQARR